MLQKKCYGISDCCAFKKGKAARPFGSNVLRLPYSQLVLSMPKNGQEKAHLLIEKRGSRQTQHPAEFVESVRGVVFFWGEFG